MASRVFTDESFVLAIWKSERSPASYVRRDLEAAGIRWRVHDGAEVPTAIEQQQPFAVVAEFETGPGVFRDPVFAALRDMGEVAPPGVFIGSLPPDHWDSMGKYMISTSNLDPGLTAACVSDDAEMRSVTLLCVRLAQLRAMHDQDQVISVEEARKLEVVLAGISDLIEGGVLRDEIGAATQAAVETIRAQMVSPTPDRTIIGRSLRALATFSGGLLIGVSGNYLTDLLKAFHVPWP